MPFPSWLKLDEDKKTNPDNYGWDYENYKSGAARIPDKLPMLTLQPYAKRPMSLERNSATFNTDLGGIKPPEAFKPVELTPYKKPLSEDINSNTAGLDDSSSVIPGENQYMLPSLRPQNYSGDSMKQYTGQSTDIKPNQPVKKSDKDPDWLKAIGISLMEGIAQTIGSFTQNADMKGQIGNELDKGLDKSLADNSLYKSIKDIDSKAGKQTSIFGKSSLVNANNDLIHKADEKMDNAAAYWQDKTSDTTGAKRLVTEAVASVPQFMMNYLPGGMALFGLSASGSYAKDAEADGATVGQQALHGAIGGAIEAGTEKLEVDKLKNTALGKWANLGAKNMLGKFGEGALTYLGDIATEFIQEAAADPLSNMSKKAIYNHDMSWTGKGGVFDSQMWHSGEVGGVMGAILGAMALPFGYKSRRMAENVIKSNVKDPEAINLVQEQLKEDLQDIKSPEELNSILDTSRQEEEIKQQPLPMPGENIKTPEESVKIPETVNNIGEVKPELIENSKTQLPVLTNDKTEAEIQPTVNEEKQSNTFTPMEVAAPQNSNMDVLEVGKEFTNDKGDNLKINSVENGQYAVSERGKGRTAQMFLDEEELNQHLQENGYVKPQNDILGYKKEWGTHNQYLEANPYYTERQKMTPEEAKNNPDKWNELVKKSNLWEVEQVANGNKPAYLGGFTDDLFTNDILDYAYRNKLKVEKTKNIDGQEVFVIAKDNEALNKVIAAVQANDYTPQKQRELGLALGYADIHPIENTNTQEQPKEINSADDLTHINLDSLDTSKDPKEYAQKLASEMNEDNYPYYINRIEDLRNQTDNAELDDYLENVSNELFSAYSKKTEKETFEKMTPEEVKQHFDKQKSIQDKDRERAVEKFVAHKLNAHLAKNERAELIKQKEALEKEIREKAAAGEPTRKLRGELGKLTKEIRKRTIAITQGSKKSYGDLLGEAFTDSGQYTTERDNAFTEEVKKELNRRIKNSKGLKSIENLNQRFDDENFKFGADNKQEPEQPVENTNNQSDTKSQEPESSYKVGDIVYGKKGMEFKITKYDVENDEVEVVPTKGYPIFGKFTIDGFEMEFGGKKAAAKKELPKPAVKEENQSKPTSKNKYDYPGWNGAAEPQKADMSRLVSITDLKVGQIVAPVDEKGNLMRVFTVKELKPNSTVMEGYERKDPTFSFGNVVEFSNKEKRKQLYQVLDKNQIIEHHKDSIQYAEQSIINQKRTDDYYPDEIRWHNEQLKKLESKEQKTATVEEKKPEKTWGEVKEDAIKNTVPYTDLKTGQIVAVTVKNYSKGKDWHGMGRLFTVARVDNVDHKLIVDAYEGKYSELDGMRSIYEKDTLKGDRWHVFNNKELAAYHKYFLDYWKEKIETDKDRPTDYYPKRIKWHEEQLKKLEEVQQQVEPDTNKDIENNKEGEKSEKASTASDSSAAARGTNKRSGQKPDSGVQENSEGQNKDGLSAGVQEASGEKGASGNDTRPSGASSSEVRPDNGTGNEDNSKSGLSETGRGNSTASEHSERESDGDIKQSTIGSSNVRLNEDSVLYEGGKKTRYENNVAAIKLVKQLQAEDRYATKEEQEVLMKYVGWGGVAEAFNEDIKRVNGKYEYIPKNPAWAKEYYELKELLSEEEYRHANGSALNAHYTPPKLIKSMYSLVEHLGFKGGSILEPSMGIGHFFGFLPNSMINKKTSLFGVELDPITGLIAKYLYPEADIRISGFQNVSIPDNYFDIAIGNVPFGSYGVSDKSYKNNAITDRIHNYFFIKSLDKVKPGGLVAFITSEGTMNNPDPTIRNLIAAKADLVTGIRLPNDSFKENAGTEVTTDLLVFRKRLPSETPNKTERWTNTVDTELKNQYGNRVIEKNNEYFENHPENVLGLPTVNKLYGRGYAVASDGRDIEQAIKEIIEKLPQNIISSMRNKTVERIAPEKQAEMLKEVKEGSYFTDNGKVYQKKKGELKEVATNTDKIKSLIDIKAAVKDILAAQLRKEDESSIKKLQEKLSKAYEKHVKKFGHLRDIYDSFEEKAKPGSARAVKDDPEFYLLNALELVDEDKGTVSKSDIFTKIIKPKEAIKHADTAQDALSISLDQIGYFNIDEVSKLYGKSVEQTLKELKGLVYKNPEGSYETADEYLSGNVKNKLKAAIAAAELDSSYNENVKALEAVQPPDIPFTDIKLELGASWIPSEHYRDFVAELLHVPEQFKHHVVLKYNTFAGTWSVETTSRGLKDSVEATNDFGTGRIDAYSIIEHALNLTKPIIKDVWYEKGVKHERTNEAETEAALMKMESIKEEFERWVWLDKARREELSRMYNDRFNNLRGRKYNGDNLSFVGLNPAINEMVRKHQKEAIARIVYGGNTLLAHAVGAGKTWEMIIGAMELKRLGLRNKNLIVVPNNMLGQFQNDFNLLYPNAKVLFAEEDDFNPQNIKNLFASIATNDWDAVVIRHASLLKMPVSKDTKAAYYNERISEVRNAILEAAGDRNVTKELQTALKNLEKQLDDLSNLPTYDVVTFEEMGIDQMFVDEAHEFKNLKTFTKLSRTKGVSTTNAEKSDDMYMKVRYVSNLHDGKHGVVFATGTPLSNSLTELYTQFKYLRPDLLKERNISHFDSWVSTFGRIVTDMEIDGTNNYKATDRFKKFMNLPELIKLFKEFADIKMPEELNLPKPQLEGGKPITIEVTPPPEYKQKIIELNERKEALKGKGRPQKGEDNHLSINNEAKLATIDLRLLDPEMYEDYEGSKINRASQEIYSIWKETKARKATQLVFLNNGVSWDETFDKNGKLKKVERFNLYKDLVNKLVAAGIPRKEIALASDYPNKKRKTLYQKMNSGEIRVLIGTNASMGTGLNVQKKLFATHELDVPYRPSDLEQGEGRMIRQGNEHMKLDIPVRLYRYIGNETFDAFMWQMIENKRSGINSVMKGDENLREMDDIEGEADIDATMKAIATGNPLNLEKNKLQKEVKKLMNGYHQYVSSKLDMQDKIAAYPDEIEGQKEFLSNLQTDKAKFDINSLRGDNFKVIVENKEFTNREEAGKLLIDIANKFNDQRIAANLANNKVNETKLTEEPNVIGRAGNFEITMLYHNLGYNKHMEMYLENPDTKGKYNIDWSGKTPIGIWTTVNNVYDRIGALIGNTEDEIKRKEEYLTKAKEAVNKPYEHEEKLNGMKARLHEVNIALGIEKAPTAAAASGSEVPEQFKGDDPNGNLGIVAPGFFKPKGVSPQNGYKGFSDPGLEEAYKNNYGLDKSSLLGKIKKLAVEFSQMATRTFREVDPKEFPEFVKSMVQYNKIKKLSADETVKVLDTITKHLSKKSFDIFNRMVVLKDFEEEAALGHELPDGWTEFNVDRELKELENHMTPDVEKALELREKFWDTFKGEYIESMEYLGFHVKDRFSRENYFRHEVMEYMNAERANIKGNGKQVKLATGRGFLKQRQGSTKSINYSYLEAEYEVLAQFIHDKKVADVIRNIVDSYDISGELKKQAKIDGGNWHDFVPSGYTLWQPREGNAFYHAESIPQQIAENLLEDVKKSEKITKDDLKTLLAKGGRYKEYVLRTELVNTMNTLFAKKDNHVISQLSNGLTSLVKRWYLTLNPLSVVKYNLRNVTGDLDKVMTNPAILKYAPKASQELFNAFKFNKFTPSLLEFRERGGFDNLTIPEEIASVTDLPMFKGLAAKKNRGKLLNAAGTAKDIASIPLKPIKGYISAAETITNYRECILRYGAYLHFKNQLAKGNVDYGASNPQVIKGLKTKEDKAYKLSKDLLGAYDELTEVGQIIRKHIIPFYSWIEVNFKGYYNLMKNGLDLSIAKEQAAAHGKNPTALRIGLHYGKNIGKNSMGIVFLTAVMALWNALKHPDEDKDLPDYVRNVPHLTFGKDSKGNILYFTKLGALSDFLEWVNAAETPTELIKKAVGKADPETSGKPEKQSLVKNAANKIIGGLNPIYKTAIEAASGKKFYPDVFDPTDIRDKKLHVAESFNVDDIYRAKNKLPMLNKSVKDVVKQALIYSSDPEANTYNKAISIKYDYLDKQGKAQGSSSSAKSDELYYFKQAVKYDDKEAAKKYLLQYKNDGGTIDGFRKSFETLDPYYGIADKNLDKFKETLTKDDVKTFERASKYYDKLKEWYNTYMIDYARELPTLKQQKAKGK